MNLLNGFIIETEVRMMSVARGDSCMCVSKAPREPLTRPLSFITSHSKYDFIHVTIFIPLKLAQEDLLLW